MRIDVMDLRTGLVEAVEVDGADGPTKAVVTSWEKDNKNVANVYPGLIKGKLTMACGDYSAYLDGRNLGTPYRR